MKDHPSAYDVFRDMRIKSTEQDAFNFVLDTVKKQLEKENPAPVHSDRTEVSPDHVDRAMELLVGQFLQRLDEKGNLSHASYHESLGIVTEEYNELSEAVHSKITEHMVDEALDVCVASLFMVASALANGDYE